MRVVLTETRLYVAEEEEGALWLESWDVVHYMDLRSYQRRAGRPTESTWSEFQVSYSVQVCVQSVLLVRPLPPPHALFCLSIYSLIMDSNQPQDSDMAARQRVSLSLLLLSLPLICPTVPLLQDGRQRPPQEHSYPFQALARTISLSQQLHFFFSFPFPFILGACSLPFCT